MKRDGFTLALIFVLTEAGCFGLAYTLLNTAFGNQVLFPPFRFLILGAVFAAANYYLAQGRYRYLTVGVVNLVLLSAGLVFTIGRGSFSALRLPADAGGIVNYLLAYTFLIWLFLRGFWLVRTKTLDIYGHFDLIIALQFVIYLFACLTQTSLPGGLIWLLSLFGLNLAKLHLGHVTREREGSIRTWPLLVCLLFPALLAAVSEPVFAVGVAPAAQILDVLKSLLNIVGRVALAVLLFFLRLMRMVPKQDAVQESPASPPVVPEEAAAYAPGWLDKIMQAFLWLAVVALALACLGLLSYAIYRLARWLWRRQEGPASDGTQRKLWSVWLQLLKRLASRISDVLMLFLPGKVDSLRAYGCLLRWGKARRLPRQPEETPYEYLERLRIRFPGRETELEAITEGFVASFYGGCRAGVDFKLPLRRLCFSWIPFVQ